MDLAAQIAAYRVRGFTGEQAEVITMMQLAAGVLFQDFPDSFLLFGGATLLLFHDSVRHSADLDLTAESGQATNVRGSSCLACGRTRLGGGCAESKPAASRGFWRQDSG